MYKAVCCCHQLRAEASYDQKQKFRQPFTFHLLLRHHLRANIQPITLERRQGTAALGKSTQ